MPVKPIAAGPGAGTEGLEPSAPPLWSAYEREVRGLTVNGYPTDSAPLAHQKRMDALNPHAKPENISAQIAAQEAQSDRLWEFFNWGLIRREAAGQLAQARSLRMNHGALDTLEYWCAWCAHRNLAAVILDTNSK